MLGFEQARLVVVRARRQARQPLHQVGVVEGQAVNLQAAQAVAGAGVQRHAQARGLGVRVNVGPAGGNLPDRITLRAEQPQGLGLGVVPSLLGETHAGA